MPDRLRASAISNWGVTIPTTPEVGEMRIDYPVHSRAFKRDRQRVERIMRTPPAGTHTRNRKAFIDRVQHRDHRPLDDLAPRTRRPRAAAAARPPSV